jgi:simple sugar transport system ATP-binding protein
VLREGRDVGTFAVDDIDRAELISVMLGQDLDSLRLLGSGTRPHRQEPEGDPIYRTDRLGLRRAVAPVDIDLYRGEILGFAGLRGSGRTEFANVMTGSLRADTGEARIDGHVVKMRDPAQALRLRLGMVTEDAADDGLVTGLTVRQNIVLARQALRGWANPVGADEADTLVEELTESLSIPADLIDEPVDRLSTGNRRRVALARILATRPRVLILDDPTRGADVTAKAAIERKIERLAGDGVAVVYISSEMEDVVRLSDRIAIFRDREKIAEVSSGPGLSVDTIVELIADDSHYDM